jgi:hypothetical protein
MCPCHKLFTSSRQIARSMRIALRYMREDSRSVTNTRITDFIVLAYLIDPNRNRRKQAHIVPILHRPANHLVDNKRRSSVIADRPFIIHLPHDASRVLRGERLIIVSYDFLSVIRCWRFSSTTLENVIPGDAINDVNLQIFRIFF